VSLNAPLIGIALSEESASAVVEHLDAESVKAKQLNYALLSLGQPRDKKGNGNGVGNLLAAGGTARIYAGSYKGETMAIKLVRFCFQIHSYLITLVPH
jgi:hypothetical protein